VIDPEHHRRAPVGDDAADPALREDALQERLDIATIVGYLASSERRRRSVRGMGEMWPSPR
jgi:hypothetical protein